MASFTSNTLQQQKQIFSITVCKYPSPLNTFKFHHVSHFLSTFSPSKHKLQSKFSQRLVDRPHVSHTCAKLSTTDHEISTNNMNLRTKKQTDSGFSSSRSVNEEKGKNSVETLFSSKLEEKGRTEKRFTKDMGTRKKQGFRKRRDMGTGNSSVRSKYENIAIRPSKIAGSVAIDEKLGKRNKDRGNNEAGEGSVGKRSKKNKDESPGVQLKVELDMCSKRGDVIGAIQLYDKAQREGIKMNQYHYTVVLYLCSSAAVGVVRPAKSGSGSRTLNTLGFSNEVSSVNSMELGETRDRSNGNSSGSELNIPVSKNGRIVGTSRTYGDIDKMDLSSSNRFDNLVSSFDEKEDLTQFSNGSVKPISPLSDRLKYQKKSNEDHLIEKDGSGSNKKYHEILVSEDFKKYAHRRGFEIYQKMCLDNVPMNEATLTAVARMAMSMGNGDMAFDMVKQMKSLGINPRLRSYGPALSVFCSSGDIDKAFAVQKHMLEHGVYPEEPELEALLRLSVGAGKRDKVYYLLHRLRTTVRKVSPSTADIIVKWFASKAASRVGKEKWDQRLIREAIENGGGGWHGQGWVGKGKWNVSHTTIGADALCKCCGEKLSIIDLDPTETENFAKSVASIAIRREKNSSFQKFQKWLDYYGPFEAVVDAANVGLYSQKRFLPSKVNAVVNGIRQMLPSRKWPLIVLHNKRITAHKMDQPANRTLIEKWKNADALYATPTGSNDDWYWLYAAIKFKCLLVTNDEMRDHTFQLLGNDFFPKWKERHQVHFSFSDVGPEFHMPPLYSVVIQESEKGHWHIPIASEHDYETERIWLCIARSKTQMARKTSAIGHEDLQPLNNNDTHARSATQTDLEINSKQLSGSNNGNRRNRTRDVYQNLRDILSGCMISNHCSVLSELEAAEKLGNCVIDFQI